MSAQDEKVQFAIVVLNKLGVPPLQSAVQKVVAWENQEGGHFNNSARFNPLNTTLALPGAGNTGSQGNIKVYRSWAQGIEATVKTLKAPVYAGIIAQLRSGGNPAAFEAAVTASPWGTKFPGAGNAVSGASASATGAAGLLGGGGLSEKTKAAGETAASVLGFSWEKLGSFALTTVLLLVGAVLVIYGIMVAVRPRDRALSLPTPPVPVPV